MIRKGSVGRHDLICRAGTAEWIECSNAPIFRNLFPTQDQYPGGGLPQDEQRPQSPRLQPADARRKKSPIITLFAYFVAAIVVGGAWAFLSFDGASPFSMNGIQNQVSADAVKEYDIAKRGGNKIDVCVHAGLVAAAYLQAKDEARYRLWKATEAADCTVAGIRR